MEWIKITDNAARFHDKVPPGKTQLLIVRGRRICLGNVEGKVYAIDNKCSHNGESLSKGSINYLGEVICPWHGHRFTMETGQSQNNDADLETFPIREDDSGVYIGF